MSSQSSVYDDPVDFDRLNLNDSFDGTNSSSINQKPNDDEQSNSDDLKELDKTGYLEDYFKIENQHQLQSTWCIWYSKLSKSQGTDDFESKLQLVAQFQTVEQFWNLFCYLKRPQDFEILTELHIFKDGIKPMWEHTRNRNGGKFILKVKKEVVSRLWEDLLLSVLGEQFLVGDEITGVVLSIRHYFCALCIWNGNSKNKLVINHIKDTLKRVLNLSENVQIEYKPFNQQQQQQQQLLQQQQPQQQQN